MNVGLRESASVIFETSQMVLLELGRELGRRLPGEEHKRLRG